VDQDREHIIRDLYDYFFYNYSSWLCLVYVLRQTKPQSKGFQCKFNDNVLYRVANVSNS
jgi:uncharacterized protein YutD